MNHHSGKWEKKKNRPYLKDIDENIPDSAEKALRLLIQQVNTNLQKSQVPIHIGLVKEEKGYALDIYDCTDGISCKLVKDEPIHLQDLPDLLKNLQQEVGILIDCTA